MKYNWKHFTLKELTKSETASKFNIDNTPDKYVVSNLDKLVTNVLDPIRESWGRPIKVTSGYRCFLLNQLVGGSKTSQHMNGKAADIQPIDYKDIDEFISFFKKWCESNEFDQCIIERSKNAKWIHISFDEGRNRKKVFSLTK